MFWGCNYSHDWLCKPPAELENDHFFARFPSTKFFRSTVGVWAPPTPPLTSLPRDFRGPSWALALKHSEHLLEAQAIHAFHLNWLSAPRRPLLRLDLAVASSGFTWGSLDCGLSHTDMTVSPRSTQLGYVLGVTFPSRNVQVYLFWDVGFWRVWVFEGEAFRIKFQLFPVQHE